VNIITDPGGSKTYGPATTGHKSSFKVEMRKYNNMRQDWSLEKKLADPEHWPLGHHLK
jgi:hypothetical protein